jgi:general stress protein 26
MVRLEEPQEAFIGLARVARLATADAQGQPHVVPICPILHDGKIYLGSERNRKVRNIRENPKVALAFDDYTEDWNGLRGLTVFGEVTRVIESGPDFPGLRDLIYEKFPQFPSQAGGVEEPDSVIIEIEIERVAGEI